MAIRWGNNGNSDRLYVLGLQNHCRWWLQKTLAPWKKRYDQLGSILKKQRHYFANKCPSSQSYGFSSSYAWIWEVDYKESWTLNNWFFWTVILEKILESPLDSKENQPVHPKVLNIHWKDWCWIWNSNTLATCCEELTHWKRPWWWERMKARGEGNDRGWDGWMASLTQGRWVWPSSWSWWQIGKHGVLQSMGLQRVRHDWSTELNWTDTYAEPYPAEHFTCRFLKCKYFNKSWQKFFLASVLRTERTRNKANSGRPVGGSFINRIVRAQCFGPRQ